jgi:hypothetical protein
MLITVLRRVTQDGFGQGVGWDARWLVFRDAAAYDNRRGVDMAAAESEMAKKGCMPVLVFFFFLRA